MWNSKTDRQTDKQVFVRFTLTAGTGLVGVDTLAMLLSVAVVVGPASRNFFLYDAMTSFFSVRYGPKLGRL